MNFWKKWKAKTKTVFYENIQHLYTGHNKYGTQNTEISIQMLIYSKQSKIEGAELFGLQSKIGLRVKMTIETQNPNLDFTKGTHFQPTGGTQCTIPGRRGEKHN